MAHSKIGASSYSRWSTIHGGCPGSVRLSEGVPSQESEYAKEGTLAHDIAAFFLEKLIFGKKAKNRHVTTEMREAVNVYVDYILKTVKYAAADKDKGHVLIEHKFNLESIHPGLFGTADAVIYSPWEKKLTVADFKYGAGIPVEVEGNLQLQYYGLGALLSSSFPVEFVELTIIQPRCEHPDGPIRSHKFKAIELLDFAADLKHDAEMTEKEDAPLNPGNHCRFCPAAATKCPAIRDQAQALAKLEFKPEFSYDPDQLGKALNFIPALESWIKQVREFAYGEAIHGRTPPGWKIVEKRPTRKWKSEEAVVIDYMKTATKKDVSEFYNLTLKSPAQMEKLLSKQLGTGLREHIETVSSGYNLVPESDKRPSAKLDPKSEFTAIQGGQDGD